MAHNVIFGRPLLNKIKIVTLIYHFSIKLLTSEWIGKVRDDRVKSRNMINTMLLGAK